MTKKLKNLISGFILLALVCNQNSFTQTQNCFRIGAHSHCGPDYSQEHMFLNLFMQNSGGFSGNSAVPCDTNGYPVAIPYGTVTNITTFISRGEGVLMQDTIYVCRWDGDGDFNLTTWPGTNTATMETGTYSSTPSGGRFEFHAHYPVSGGGDKQIILRMTRSASANHVRNIRIYKTWQENLYEVQGQKYDPYFLRYIEPLWIIRFMGAFNINNSTFKTWTDRTTPTWNNQTHGNHGQGLSYEWACDLCNTAKKNMWFNVPHAADNDAIRKMAQTVYKNLNSDLDIYLEYSNETWNYAGPYFQQFAYVQNYPGGHAALSRNIFKIWREVFGKDSLRVKRVLASIGVSDVNHISMGRIQSTGVDNFDVWSVSYYWGMINTSWCSVDQAVTDLFASVRNTSGEWYKRMKNHSSMAKQYGKEMFCYEGGWGSDPQDYHNFSCLNIVQQLQIDPRVKDLTKEVFDTLKNFGIYGGNELALLGGWKPNAVNNLVAFWGLFDNAAVDPMTYPKFAGVAESVEDCDHLTKASDTIGAGLALRMDGVNDYVDASLAFKPNDASDSYTIETWVRPEYLGTDQYIWALAGGLSPAGNNLYIGTDNRIHWAVKNNAGGTVASLNGPLVEVNKWYHIAVTKSSSSYKLYVNGSEKASTSGSISGDCSRSRLILGAYINNGTTSLNFRGRIDEFRIWNMAITSLTTIRDWMCRKIKSSHPNYANLRANYRFDIVDPAGLVDDRFGAFDAQLHNVLFSKYSNYMSSGAPIGDNSVQIYPPNWNSSSLTYFHTNGDRLTATGLGTGTPEGVHIYMVGQKPTNSTAPSDQYLSVGNYYYGIFTANGTPGVMPTYVAQYNYAGNPGASATDANNRLLKRINNDDAEGWQNSGAILNALAKTLITRTNRESYCGEYLIGQRPSLDRNLPGPGYSLSFNGTGNAQIEYERPDKEYTVSFWFKANDPWNQHSGCLLTFRGPGYQNFSRFSYSSLGDLAYTMDKYWDATTVWSSRIVDQSGWNHLAVAKKNDLVTVYYNGKQYATAVPAGKTAGGNIRDIDLTKIIIGTDPYDNAQFNGQIDELQIWDTALSQTAIREWMCRKVTNKTPNESGHLLLYYKFDEGQGAELENTRGPGDLTLSAGVTFAPSGAPVGDTSVYVYSVARADAINLSIYHPDGDYLNITKAVGASPENDAYGAHLYRVDGKAQFSTIPGSILSLDSTRYWGVYIVPVGYTGTNRYQYTARYYYQNNKNVVDEANIRLMDRINNSAAAWNLNTAIGDTANNRFSYVYTTITSTNPPFWHPNISMPHEFILGGITPTAISVDTARPAQPGPISGPVNVCSGAFEIVYSVAKIPGYGITYNWTLPAGMTGLSDSNSITVSVAPSASGPLGNISVSAINRNGEGPARTLAVTAQLVPSLSVDINGPVEVCSGQSGNYSIPTVPGATAYEWLVTDDGTITANTGTAMTVKFGILSGTISVIGTFGCGTSVLNTKAVTVNVTPDAELEIQGGRACRGEMTEGYVTVKNSQIGVQYQAYRNSGTSPVGQPAYGTGMDLRLILPLVDLLAGDNPITVKALSPGCSGVTMTQVAIFGVDVAPDPDMPLDYSMSICVGDSAKIKFPNALAGMKVIPKIVSYWRVDDPTPKYINTGFILKDPDKQIAIPPSVYNGQLSSGNGPGGINKGRNDITFTIENGSCATVSLTTKAIVTVPNSPHTINFNSTGLQWWITTGSPWNPIPDYADSIRVATNRSTSPICQTDSMTYTIYNAQANIKYYARIFYNTNGYPGVPGPTVSNEVTPTADHSTVYLKVPSMAMPITPGTNYNDYDEIEVIAEGNPCKPVLASYRYQVLPGPDTTRMAVGSTICMGDNGTITIRNSQNGLTYRAYYTDLINPIASVAGNGGDAVMTIPGSPTFSALGNYSFTVTVGSSNCLYVAYPRKTIISVVNLSGFIKNNAVKLAFDCDTTCKGLDDSVWVANSSAGVSYRAYVNNVAVGTATIGTGMNMAITLPYADLASHEGTTVTVTVKATAGSCITDVLLDNSKQLYINGTVDLTNELVSINKSADWRNDGTFMICPPIVYPVQFPVRLNTDTMSGTNYYPVLFKGGYTNSTLKNDTLLTGIYGYQNAAGAWVNLNYNNTVLPQRTLHYLEVFVKEKGCPLHGARRTRHTNQYINTNSRLINVYPDFDPTQLVFTDTVCVGNTAKVQVKTQEDRMSPWGGEYRMMDTVNNINVTGNISNRWGTRVPPTNNFGNLVLPVSAPSYINPGVNVYRVDMQFGGCPTWFTLDTRGRVIANNLPNQALIVSGKSYCDADGMLYINNTQGNVKYQGLMGSSGVTPSVYGNGDTLKLPIDKDYLIPGTNDVSVRAVIKGCPAVLLANHAIFDAVTTPPAKPAIPTGPASACPGATGLAYSVTNDINALSYTWHLPSGSTTTSTSNTAVVNLGSFGGYIKVTANNSCGASAYSDSILMTLLSSGGGTVTGKDSACEGENIILTLTGFSGSVQKWEYSEDMVGWTDINDTNKTIDRGAIHAPAYYRAFVGSIGGCASVYSNILSIAMFSYPDTLLGILTPSLICSADEGVVKVFPTQLGVNYFLADAGGTAQSSLVSGSGDTVNITVLASALTADGIYTFDILAEMENLCRAKLDTQAVINASVAPVEVLGSDSITCLKDTITYSTAAANKTYLWTLDDITRATIVGADTSASVRVLWDSAGYHVLTLATVDKLTGCAKSTAVNVAANIPLPLITCPADTTVIADYDAATKSFGYTIKGGILDATTAHDCNFGKIYNNYNLTITVGGETLSEMENEIVWFTVNTVGKESSCTTKVSLKNDEGVEPPSAFSPNGDGYNDVWKIAKIELHPQAVVKVFNRWGELVYDSGKFGSYFGHEWDGLDIGGAKLPIESYHYVIDLKNGKKAQRGVITILR